MRRDFKDLKVWQVADRIFDMITTDIVKFPRNRIAFSLSDQIIRSVGSISANIAEGYGRGSDKELHRSLIIARGEMTESISWLVKLNKLKYISDERFSEYEENFLYLSKKVTNFIGEIRKRIK